MKKPILLASAKPKAHQVKVLSRIFIFGHIQTKALNDDQCYLYLMRQAAKVTLRRVKYIVGTKNNLNERYF